MLDEERKILSQVRLEKAKENLAAAYTLISSNDYKIASTRTYYAVFHAMRAVLALDGVDMKHHSGIISEFRKQLDQNGDGNIGIEDVIEKSLAA